MQSPFQTAFPLSPSKFWKKFLASLFSPALFTLIMFCIPFIMLAAFTHGDYFKWALLFVGVLVIMLIMMNAWYISSYIKSYYYADENGFITIRKGVFMPTEIHVQYSRIQDVYVDQDLLDKMLGIYDVHIATATMTSGIEAHIDGVDAATAEGLKNFFLTQMRNGSPVVTQPVVPDQPTFAGQVSIAPIVPAAIADLSSNHFPLGSAWVRSQLVQSLFMSVVVFGGLCLVLVAKLQDLSFIQDSAGNIGGYIVGIVILATLSAVPVVFLQKKNYAFNFGPDFVTYRFGIITVQEQHVPYSKIQDVTISQDFISRVFGIWTVRIENAAQQQYGPNIQNSRIAIMGLTKEQADFISGQARTIMTQAVHAGRF